MKRALCGLACALLVTTAACSNDGEARPGELTYYRDIKPIIDAKCARCHFAGGVPPMPLTSYEEVAEYGGVIKAAVGAGIMPPWHPSPECNDYVAVRALDEAHKAAILGWVDAGVPAGDPASEGPPIEVESTTLSRVDLTLAMPEPYQPANDASRSDDYRCFIVPWPETTTRYVTGSRMRPGNAAVAHHAIAFLAPPSQAATYMALDAADPGPGWSCFGGPGGPGAPDWLSGWAPGNDGADLAGGLGIEVQPGSFIVLQMHYHTMGAVGPIQPDRTSMDLQLTDQVDRKARILPWANPGWVMGTAPMLIPANQPDVMHAFAFDPTVAPLAGASRVTIYNTGLHLHRLGTRARLSIERAGGASTCLLQIDAWDFDWQSDYTLRVPQVLMSGDRLRVECHWDNTLANQPIVNGQPQAPQDVTWGEGSSDEMCLGLFLVAAE